MRSPAEFFLSLLHLTPFPLHYASVSLDEKKSASSMFIASLHLEIQSLGGLYSDSSLPVKDCRYSQFTFALHSFSTLFHFVFDYS